MHTRARRLPQKTVCCTDSQAAGSTVLYGCGLYEKNMDTKGDQSSDALDEAHMHQMNCWLDGEGALTVVNFRNTRRWPGHKRGGHSHSHISPCKTMRCALHTLHFFYLNTLRTLTLRPQQVGPSTKSPHALQHTRPHRTARTYGTPTPNAEAHAPASPYGSVSHIPRLGPKRQGELPWRTVPSLSTLASKLICNTTKSAQKRHTNAGNVAPEATPAM